MEIDKEKFIANINTINFKVRNMLTNRGMTMKELAKQIGVQPDSLSRSLSQNPTFKTLFLIAQGLQCDVADLMPASTQKNSVRGVITKGDKYYIINSKNDLEDMIENFSKK